MFHNLMKLFVPKTKQSTLPEAYNYHPSPITGNDKMEKYIEDNTLPDFSRNIYKYSIDSELIVNLIGKMSNQQKAFFQGLPDDCPTIPTVKDFRFSHVGLQHFINQYLFLDIEEVAQDATKRERFANGIMLHLDQHGLPHVAYNVFAERVANFTIENELPLRATNLINFIPIKNGIEVIETNLYVTDPFIDVDTISEENYEVKVVGRMTATLSPRNYLVFTPLELTVTIHSTNKELGSVFDVSKPFNHYLPHPTSKP